MNIPLQPASTTLIAAHKVGYEDGYRQAIADVVHIIRQQPVFGTVWEGDDYMPDSLDAIFEIRRAEMSK